MNIGFYSAKEGLIATQQGMDVISNNVANISTTGYKELRPSFSDLLYTVQKPQNEEAQTGHGSKLAKTDLMCKQGQLIATNRALDFATPTQGFFAVKDENGNVKYTRDGAFHLSQNNGTWELVNTSGMKVLDYNGNAVTVPLNDGNVNYSDIMNEIGVYKFANPYGLEAGGSNTYQQTASSGEAVADRSLDKLSNTLEMSTVDMGDQMVKVIQYQRAFQLNSKMVQTNDEIESIVNNLR